MRKLLLTFAAAAAVYLAAADASAAAHFVYHEQTGNFVAAPTCPSAGTDTACGRYVENTDRDGAAGYQIYSPETYSLHFKVEFQFLTDNARVYYTTDGTTPTVDENCSDSPTVCSPTPTGTTQVASASYSCTYQDQTQGCQVVDVVAGAIPPQPAGTTVKYILAAWLAAGGEVVYANSGTCAGCFSCTDSSTGCASVFEYGVTAAPATPLVISEFRLRGPGGAEDEFVEIYNNSDSPVTVQAYDGSAGFALAASDFVPRFNIPNGVTIPARAHYLAVNSDGYTLGNDPPSITTLAGGGGDGPDAPVQSASPASSAGGRKRKAPARATPSRGLRRPGGGASPETDTVPAPSATANGDATYAEDIADNAGIALFNTANVSNFSETTRLDAVGSTSEANTLFKEGAGYPALGGPAYFTGLEHSFFRDTCGKGGSVVVFGNCFRSTPQDTDSNEADFLFVETDATDAGAGSRLGAPGPENSTSPVQRTSSFPGSRIFPCVASSASPNRAREFASDPANNSSLGTMSIRIRVTNSTGKNVTRLRFRVIDLTTTPVPSGIADLRARSSSNEVVADPCTSLLTPVLGTTLEQPPTQPAGGGFNSTLSAGTVTPATPLLPGATYDFQLRFGIEQAGRFKAYVIVEALP